MKPEAILAAMYALHCDLRKPKGLLPDPMPTSDEEIERKRRLQREKMKRRARQTKRNHKQSGDF